MFDFSIYDYEFIYQYCLAVSLTLLNCLTSYRLRREIWS